MPLPRTRQKAEEKRRAEACVPLGGSSRGRGRLESAALRRRAACRPKGAVSKTYDYCWRQGPDSPAANEEKAPFPKVSGSGYQAHAALVSSLAEDGFGGTAYEVAGCSSFAIGDGVEVASHGEGKRSIDGTNKCGRMVCPICCPYIMAKRQEALEPLVLRLSQNKELRFFYCVLTLRHKKGAKWRELVDVLREVLRGMTQGADSKWRKWIKGMIRTLESTYGRNGHHPHLNLVLVCPANIDPAEFFGWFARLFAKRAKDRGRSVEWVPGWWSEVPPERLLPTVRYLGKDEKMGNAPSALRESLGATTKHQPLWCLPSHAFSEIYMTSKKVRWFDTSGLFAGTDADKSDEELSEERTSEKPKMAYISRDVLLSWTPKERRDRWAVISDRTLTDAQVVEVVVAWGGLAGPRPDPWAGMDDSPPKSG